MVIEVPKEGLYDLKMCKLVGVLFYVAAYGDEDALGGINVQDMYGNGNPSHMEVLPTRINLEQCKD